MCGICGYVSLRNVEHRKFEKMVDVLSHRGPDDRGIWECSNGKYSIALGHRRLSILDLSAAGHQPMSDESGRYHIVFNGEIYNYRELRKEISEFNVVSGTDTEILLYLYIKHGMGCLKYLNGMFAFAIYDMESNSLFMARDRMGKKPLYYYSYGEEFVFASELKSIMLYPFFIRKINKEVLVQYFSQNCILAPSTIFNDTCKLRAGEYLLWKDGAVDVKRYYSPIRSYFDEQICIEGDYTECKKKLKALLYDSVEKRLIADVPVGTFLSGGIDSTLITAITSDIRGDKGVDTFTIGFSDKEFDESVFAAESAKLLGTRHHERIMSTNDMLEMLTDIATYYDEPFADYSQLPTMLVSKFARESVTVVLSGDGGDELFAGYSNIDTISKLKKYDLILGLMRLLTPSAVVDLINSDIGRIILDKKQGIEKIQYYAKIRERLAKEILIYNSGSGIINDQEIAGISDWKQQRMLLDISRYLPDEIMTKTDRASMRFSLEMRCPILDYRIVELSMRIPMKYKYNNQIKKYILKDILYDYIPPKMMARPKKGFGAPVRAWLTNELRGELDRYLAPRFIEEQGIFNSAGVRRLYELFRKRKENSTTQLMWSYYVFQLWCETYDI